MDNLHLKKSLKNTKDIDNSFNSNEKVEFIFIKNNQIINEKYFSVYIVSDRSKEIKNEFIKSIIHLLYENIYYSTYFTSSIKEINSLEEKIVENFSIDYNTGEIISYTESNFFINSILMNLKKISSGDMYSPVTEIKFSKLI